MCPSAPRVCSEPGGQKPALSLPLDRINKVNWTLTKFFQKYWFAVFLLQENLIDCAIYKICHFDLASMRSAKKIHTYSVNTAAEHYWWLEVGLINDSLTKTKLILGKYETEKSDMVIQYKDILIHHNSVSIWVLSHIQLLFEMQSRAAEVADSQTSLCKAHLNDPIND